MLSSASGPGQSRESVCRIRAADLGQLGPAESLHVCVRACERARVRACARVMCNTHLGSPQVDGPKRLQRREIGRQGSGARSTQAVRAASRVCVCVCVCVCVLGGEFACVQRRRHDATDAPGSVPSQRLPASHHGLICKSLRLLSECLIRVAPAPSRTAPASLRPSASPRVERGPPALGRPVPEPARPRPACVRAWQRVGVCVYARA